MEMRRQNYFCRCCLMCVKLIDKESHEARKYHINKKLRYSGKDFPSASTVKHNPDPICETNTIAKPKDIDLCGDFDEQVDAIMNAIRLTCEETGQLSSLFSKLTEMFQKLWPGCVAVPFGSIVTGLGIKSSEADCFLDIPEHIRKNPGSIDSFVPEATNILSRYPLIFSRVAAEPLIKVPLVKFYHIPTKTNCEVNFKTPLGARNSELIAFILKIDNRILHLCILLKYWGKVHALTGRWKLSNYALTMMVIFYLQQQPAPMLPSVQFLQSGLTYMVDHWNTAFNDQYNLLPPVNNDFSLCELLGGFFKFYARFNFTEDIICPYLGIPVKKVVFRNIKNVSDAFEIYKTNVKSGVTNPINVDKMSIQDPFQLSRNISSAVGVKLIKNIQQNIQWAASMYVKNMTNNSESGFLRKILLDKPTTGNSKDKIRITIYENVLEALAQEEWVKMVIEAFHNIFTNLLQFTVTRKGPGGPNAKYKPNKKMHKEMFLCKASKLTWRRKQFSKFYDLVKMDFVTKQVKITKEVLKFGEGNNDVHMQLVVELMISDNPRNCEVFMRRERGENSYFKEFSKFYEANIYEWFVELLKVDKIRTPNISTSSAEPSGC